MTVREGSAGGPGRTLAPPGPAAPARGRVLAVLRDLALVTVAAGATGLLVGAGTGLAPDPLLTWVCALPLLLVAPVVRPALTGPAAVAGWAAGATNLWDWSTTGLGMPVPLAAMFVTVHALVFAGLVLLFGALVRRRRDVLAVLAVPAGAVAAEYLESLASPHGTLLGLAVTQVDRAPLRALAAAVGGWGITALLYLVPACVALALLRAWRPEGRSRLRAVGLPPLVLLLALLAATGLGSNARQPDEPTSRTRVAAVVVPQPPDLPDAGTPAGDRVLAAEVDGVRLARADGAAVVVLAESTVRADDAQLAARTAALREAAGPALAVVTGVRHRNAFGAVQDEARLLVPGKDDVVYVKQHLPPGEDDGLLAGRSPGTVDVVGDTWAIAVGTDLEFPAVTREAAGAAAGLLLVPSRDLPPGDGYQSRLARLRAAEQGLPMVRAARDGRVTITDSTGLVLREAASSPATGTVLVADVPLAGGRTLYGRIGDLLPWLCGLLLAVAVALALEPLRFDPDADHGWFR